MSNRHTRRAVNRIALTAFVSIVAACAATPSGPQPPTLAQVQAWVSSIVAELPAVGATLQAAGELTGQALTDFNTAVAAVQAALPQLMALTPSSANAQAIVTAVLNALMVVGGFIPQAAPFMPLLSIVLVLLNGFLNQTPVTMPGTSDPIADKPPAQAQVHAAAMAPVQTNN